MTPKDKAKEILREFSQLLPWYNASDNFHKSKRCAEIVARECKQNADSETIKYWELVEKEIKDFKL